MKKTFIIGILLLSIFSCEKNKENKDNKDYKILKSENTNGYKTITILVENEISEENLRKVMKKAAVENIGDDRGVQVLAIGDERLFRHVLNTHGIYTYYASEKDREEQKKYPELSPIVFRSKKSKLSQDAINIFKDNGELIVRDFEKSSDMTVEEEMRLMEDHIVEVSKKYGITADEVKKKLEEVGKYLDEDVVPDKEYKNQ